MRGHYYMHKKVGGHFKMIKVLKKGIMFNVVTFNPLKLKTRVARCQTADKIKENVHGIICWLF